MPGDANEVDHGAGIAPGRSVAGTDPQPFGEGDVNGQQGIVGDAFESGVQLHAVFFRQLLRRALLLGALALGRGRPPLAVQPPGETPRLLATFQGLVEGEELGSVQDVPLPGPGSVGNSGHGGRLSLKRGGEENSAVEGRWTAEQGPPPSLASLLLKPGAALTPPSSKVISLGSCPKL